MMRKIRQAVINKHVSLFYQVIGSEISLLVFWANKKDPSKRLFKMFETKKGVENQA